MPYFKIIGFVVSVQTINNSHMNLLTLMRLYDTKCLQSLCLVVLFTIKSSVFCCALFFFRFHCYTAIQCKELGQNDDRSYLSFFWNYFFYLDVRFLLIFYVLIIDLLFLLSCLCFFCQSVLTSKVFTAYQCFLL